MNRTAFRFEKQTRRATFLKCIACGLLFLSRSAFWFGSDGFGLAFAQAGLLVRRESIGVSSARDDWRRTLRAISLRRGSNLTNRAIENEFCKFNMGGGRI